MSFPNLSPLGNGTIRSQRSNSLPDGPFFDISDLEEISGVIDKDTFSSHPLLNQTLGSKDNNLESNGLNNNEEKGEGKVKKKRRYIGILLALISSLAFSIATLLVKMLIHYDPFSIATWRFQGILWPSIPIVIYAIFKEKKPVFSSIWPLTLPEKRKTFFILWLRGFSGCTAVCFSYVALKYLTLADCSVIVFSTPVFVSLVAHVVLGEKCEIFPIFTAILTFLGVFIIARPTFLTQEKEMNMDTLIGTSLAMGAMCCATATFVILRYLRKMHYALISGYFGLWGTIECVILALIFGQLQLPGNLRDWIYASITALFTFIGQTLFTTSLKFEQASVISVVRTFDVLFAFILQMIFLGEYPDIFSLIGGSIVVFGVLFLAFRKWLASRDEESPLRKSLAFLLK